MTRFERAAQEAIATRLSPRTREHYSRALKRWLSFAATARCKPEDPPDRVVTKYRGSFSLDKLANATLRNHLAALSFIYRRLSSKKPSLAARNPFDPDALPRPPGASIGKTEAVPGAVAEQMIAACETDSSALGRRDAALLRLFYDTGLRRMSVCSLQRDRIFRHEDGRRTARVRVKGSGGDELRQVEIPAETAEALDRWLAVAPAGRYVFAERSGSGPIDLSTANRIVTRRAAEVGARGVHPHRFRAAFITSGFDAGLAWRDLQAAVHHADPRSTQRYDRGIRGSGIAQAVAVFREKEKGKKP